ncbi:MAG: Rossmann-like and DUF2520 domain-containing protein [Terriglobales bacterium]
MKAKGKSQVQKKAASAGRSVAIVGAGKLAGFLAPALAQAGYRITEILARKETGSMKRARALAFPVGARAVALGAATLDAEMLWLTVPDAEIRHVAELLAHRLKTKWAGGKVAKAKTASAPNLPRFAFHSSGALGSGELIPLRKAGFSVASVHPLMTFVAEATPSLQDVPFAVEGDQAAVKAAHGIVKKLGGESFALAPGRKVAYHAWATMTSPLFLAYLVTLELGAREAGLGHEAARRMSLPILRQTLKNYAQLGPDYSFSGPFVRGDAATVEKHLTLLKRSPQLRAVYVGLARVALDRLPVRNRQRLARLLKD